MISSSRQLKDKIRNLARDKSADAQVLLRNYMMERFLERVSVSDYHQKLILKGGMLVTSMVGLEARSTMDVDATVQGATVSAGEIQKAMAEITSIDLSDGVGFLINSISDIMDEAEYPGIRVSMTATMDGIRVPVKVDLSTGDAITPTAVEYSYKLMFEDRSINLLAYNLETVLVEKLETIIARTTTNTRMRDYYDIYTLSSMYQPKIDPTVLTNALKATASTRGHLNLLYNTEKVLCDLRDDKAMQALWENYRNKFSYASEITWNAALWSVRLLGIEAGLQVKKPSLRESLQEPVPRAKRAAKSYKDELER